MGTPEYARIIGEGLAQQPNLLLRVVTRPDAPAGRGYKMTPSPVARWAIDQGLELDRPQRLTEMLPVWQAFDPDLIVTAAYGRILKPGLLTLAKLGAVNLHASLLPRWRGPNPIAWAIRAGDAMTGVSLMKMDAGVDTGPVYAQRAIPIGARVSTGALTKELAHLARDLLLESLPRVVAGILAPVPQDNQRASQAPKFLSQESEISWQQTAVEIDRRVRSMSPEPRAHTTFRGQRIQILEVMPQELAGLEPGQLRFDKEGVIVGAGIGAVRLLKIKPIGKREMAAGDWSRGIKHQDSERFE